MIGRQYCPKCRGEIYIDRDFHGWFVRCRMCSYISYLQELDVSQDNDIEITCSLSQNEVLICCRIQDHSMIN